jgi:hypothetical protein
VSIFQIARVALEALHQRGTFSEHGDKCAAQKKYHAGVKLPVQLWRFEKWTPLSYKKIAKLN